MKKLILFICAVLLCGIIITSSAEEVCMTGTVTEIEKYGHAVLDITVEDFSNAGFALGDIVTVTAGDSGESMPYLNGYYVDRGEYMLRALPDDDAVAVCINYGNYSEVAGIGVGDSVTIRLKEKAGALALQEVNNLVFVDDRSTAASDEEFANFRPVIEGKLYRSASPVDTRSSQSAYADTLLGKAGIRAVMNLAFSDQEILACFADENFASPNYKNLYDAGKVVALGLSIDFSSDEFAEGIVKGYSFLLENEGPWLVHCNQGKDRAGFACMLLEMLAGWSEDDIVADYMTSYMNYYKVKPGTEQYDLIIERDIREMMRFVAGLEKGSPLDGINWETVAEQFLLAHGMDEESVASLKLYLTE